MSTLGAEAALLRAYEEVDIEELRDNLGRLSDTLRSDAFEVGKVRSDHVAELLEALTHILTEANEVETLEASEDVLFALRDHPQLELDLELHALKFAKVAVHQQNWRLHRSAATLLAIVVVLRDPEPVTELLAYIADSPPHKAGFAVSFATAQVVDRLAPEDLVQGHMVTLLQGILQVSQRFPELYHGLNVFTSIINVTSCMQMDDVSENSTDSDDDMNEEGEVLSMMIKWIELAVEWLTLVKAKLPPLQVYKSLDMFFCSDIGSSARKDISILRDTVRNIATEFVTKVLQSHDSSVRIVDAAEMCLLLSSQKIISTQMSNSLLSSMVELFEYVSQDKASLKLAFGRLATALQRFLADESLDIRKETLKRIWTTSSSLVDCRLDQIKPDALALCNTILCESSLQYSLDPPVAAVGERIFREMLCLDTHDEDFLRISRLSFEALSRCVPLHSRELSPTRDMIKFLEREYMREESILNFGLEWILALVVHGAMSSQDFHVVGAFLRRIVLESYVTPILKKEAALIILDMQLIHGFCVLHDLSLVRELVGNDEEQLLRVMSRQEVDLLMAPAPLKSKQLHMQQTDADPKATATFNTIHQPLLRVKNRFRRLHAS